MLRNFNETARYVDQGGGKRKGSFAMCLGGARFYGGVLRPKKVMDGLAMFLGLEIKSYSLQLLIPSFLYLTRARGLLKLKYAEVSGALACGCL